LSLTRQQKEDLVAHYTEKLENSQAAILIDYRGLTVADITELRNKVRPLGGEIQVIKNTLAKISMQQLGIEVPEQMLIGPTALALCQEDIASTAKALMQFAKNSENLTVKGGLLGGRMISVDDVHRLSVLPTREALLARVVGGIQAPIGGLVGVLGGPLRSLAYVLQARANQLEEA